MSDIIHLSPSAKANRSAALRDTIDAAGTPGAIEIYLGDRPNPGGTPAGGTLLGTIPLTYPCGTTDAAGLHLMASAAGQVSTSGVPAWARIVDGGGNFVIDCTAGTEPPAVVVVAIDTPDEIAYAGSFFNLTSVTLAEGG